MARSALGVAYGRASAEASPCDASSAANGAVYRTRRCAQPESHTALATNARANAEPEYSFNTRTERRLRTDDARNRH